MEKGEMVIIDATHSRSSDFSQYNKLCSKYRYRRFYVDFSDMPIDVCKRQNEQRPEYKIVPEAVIDRIYSRLATQQKTSGWVEIPKDKFWETLEVKCFDFNEYKNIYVIGDIHSTFTPLENFFKNQPYSEDNFYIFCGDYIDRGTQPRETMEFLIKLSEKKNVLFLTGNHERFLLNHMNGSDDFSNTFKYKTLPFIKDLPHLSDFVRSLGQIAYFSFNGKKYLVSHAGISFMPEYLCSVSTEIFVKGVGDYQDDIDNVWKSNSIKMRSLTDLSEGPEIIQIHGHRNITGGDENEFSYNLEGNIEYGGYLKALKINKFGRTILKYKNEDYVPKKDGDDALTGDDIFTQLQKSEDINEKDLGNNIHSFNFSRKVFYNRSWNELNTHARGLFVDIEKRKIVARSYEKFWNIEERESSSIFSLMKTFKGQKIKAYKKENGYLGLVSLVNGELHFFTKSTDTGDYADWFKNIWKNLPIDEDYIKKHLGDCTMIFEVIDTVNDPHIIKYKQNDIILLDIIENNWKFTKKLYNELVDFASNANFTVKKLYNEFADEQAFLKWYKAECDGHNLSQTDLEGVVIEAGDETSPFMVKVKFGYYKMWKSLRSLADKVRRGHKVDLASLWSPTHNYFYDWLKRQDKEILEHDIITLRKEFEKEVMM